MRGKVIYTESKTLPGLKGNVFYHFELIEMAVYEEAGGTCIGRVVEVHNFPSMDTLEVMPEKGESSWCRFPNRRSQGSINRANALRSIKISLRNCCK